MNTEPEGQRNWMSLLSLKLGTDVQKGELEFANGLMWERVFDIWTLPKG